jgi:hypothetical protein
MTLQTPARGKVSHEYTSRDRCVLVHAGATSTLVFVTDGAETQPSRPYLSFSVDGYHGPGVYKSRLVDQQQGTLSPDFTWSFSRWDAYEHQPDVTVLTDDGALITGSVGGTLFGVQTGESAVPAEVSGHWACARGERTAPVVTSTPQSFQTVTGTGIVMTVPKGWSSDRGSQVVFTAGTPAAYVSPQPLLDPCYKNTSVTVCGTPLPLLRPDSMLLGWFEGFLPGHIATPSGAPSFTTGVGTGWIQTSSCGYALGETLLTVTVPSDQLQITACLRGPDLPLLESIAKGIMASTRSAQ